MKISVIIPVYNAENQIKDAVDSVLFQKYVSEIILVEDGSKDNSYRLCKEIESRHDIVKVYRHPGGENMGAGPSRNLGAQVAKSEFIAFLDADDLYKENRFISSVDILEETANIDGVYEATEIIVDSNEYAKSKALEHVQSFNGVISLDRKVLPDHLFDAITIQGRGFFHLNGLLIRKKSFLQIGGFSDLRLSQDINLIIKLSIMSNLHPGNLTKPVAKYILHGSNRAIADIQTTTRYRIDMWNDLIQWAQNNKLDNEKINVFKIKILIDLFRVGNYHAIANCANLFFRINPYHYLRFLFIRYFKS